VNTIAPCTGDTVTPGVVVFDPEAFITLFPVFATVSTTALQNNFNFACLQLNNSCCSVVCDAPTRSSLLNLLTAHITALLNGVNGQPPSGLVGRIATAGQGSVNVGTEFTAADFTESYYAQTPWGVHFWQSVATYRTARYVSPSYGGYDSFGAYFGAWPE
jgi:hypothetical protein